MHACSYGVGAVVELLLKHGADATTQIGKRRLYCALFCTCVAIFGVGV